MAARRKREDPKRFRALKGNAKLPTAIRKIEEEFGLPRGSVKLVYKSGRAAYKNSTVAKLKESYEKE